MLSKRPIMRSTLDSSNLLARFQARDGDRGRPRALGELSSEEDARCFFCRHGPPGAAAADGRRHVRRRTCRGFSIHYGNGPPTV